MRVKGNEPPESPPPPYPGYAQHPAAHQGDSPGAYYLQTPQGGYVTHGQCPNPIQQHPQVPYPPAHNPYSVYHEGTQLGPQVTSAHDVIIAQPQSVTGGVVEMLPPKPQSYLALSIVTCLCFSPLFGLVAICFSAASHSAYEQGDILTAKRHGTTALLLCIFGIVLSLVILVIVLTAGLGFSTKS